MTQGVGWHRIDRHSAVKKSLKLEKYIFLKKFKKRLAFCLKVVYDSRVANGSLVKRLRRRPLTAETGVRFPYQLLSKKQQYKAIVILALYCFFCYPDWSEFQYSENDKEEPTDPGKISGAMCADLPAQQQAHAGEQNAHHKSGNHGDRNGYFHECGHCPGGKAVDGHGEGKENHLFPGQIMALISVSFQGIAVDIDNETQL